MGRLRATVQTALQLITIFLVSGIFPAQAAEEADQPISIEANRMVSQENKNSVVFIGKVDARQGTLTIRAEEMTVFYTEKKGDKDKARAKENQPTNQVEKLICTNNVKISQGDWLGAGDKMEYFAKDRKAVLSGNAKAWQGQNMVSGKTIVYYLDEKRSVVEPDATTNGRVRAVIHPDSKKKP
jgi:lipopolysaccharide export system protein LptA